MSSSVIGRRHAAARVVAGDLSLPATVPTAAIAAVLAPSARSAPALSSTPSAPVAPTPPPSGGPGGPRPPVRPPTLSAVTVELLRLRRSVRQQQTLGPLLLVLIGLLQPVTVVDMPGGAGLSRTLWVTVRYFVGRDASATGPVAPSVTWGTALATAGSVAVLLAAVVVLCTWWNELRVLPARALTLVLRVSALAMVAGAAALLTGQSLIGDQGMHGSAWQVGTLLFAASGIWLVLGVTAPTPGSRPRR